MPIQRSEKFMRHAMAAHGNSVYLVALAQARSDADAQDVAQDVFCRLLTDGTAFTSDDHLRAWLLRVTVNRCRELWRTPWRRRVESADDTGRELPTPGAGTEDAALVELRADPVWQALQALPEKLRVVALLHYVEEYTTEEIARIVGSPPTTVRTRLHRARKQMREALESPRASQRRITMNRHTLEQFRTRARKVTLPEDVRESVLDEIRVEKGERARGPRRPRRERRGITRRTFVRAGAAAAGGVAAFLGANALMNHLVGEKDNWFALTAYAEGTEEADGSRLALGEKFGGRISWAEGDEMLTVSTDLNLSCTGNNVDTLTYRLEGENVSTNTDAYFRPGIWIFRSDSEGSGPVAGFTVGYNNQDTMSPLNGLLGRAVYYAVYANVPISDDLMPVFLELQETGESEGESLRRIELMHQVGLRAAELFAEELAKATLVMTAAFNDGTEQTKRYSFSPREDYVQIYDDYLTADNAAHLAGDDARRRELTQNPPSLYLITEATE